MFWFILAPHLNFHSVRDCQEYIDYAEYQNWLTVYKIEPWGTAIVERVVGRLCQLTAAAETKLGDWIQQSGLEGTVEDQQEVNRKVMIAFGAISQFQQSKGIV